MATSCGLEGHPLTSPGHDALEVLHRLELAEVPGLLEWGRVVFDFRPDGKVCSVTHEDTKSFDVVIGSRHVRRRPVIDSLQVDRSASGKEQLQDLMPVRELASER